ncbi:MAG: transketolase [Candidatus Omnitrophica bacterium]|nr:transketolase [Candidatus Omnitrophota bacterium]
MFFTFKDSIYELAKADKRVLLMITDSDIGMDHMQKEMPEQYFMEGISEANTVGMACGLAADGYVPFIVNHASFGVRRCYEQIVLDACLQERPIRMVGVGGGVATAHLGPTHTTIEDIAIMRSLPEMTVINPCDALEMKKLMPQMIDWPKAIYIRLARYGKPIVTQEEDDIRIGKAVVRYRPEIAGRKVLLVSTGAMTSGAVNAAASLKEAGIACTVLHIHTIKPLDKDALLEQASSAELIVTLEDHVLAGGLGSACLEVLMDNMDPKDLPRVRRIGFPDRFIHEYGTQESLFQAMGLQPQQVAEKIKGFLG